MLQVTGSGGPTVGTPAGGILVYQTITNAPTVYDLEGFGVQIGGSASIPIPETPISAIIGGEAHIEWGETETIFSINIFDIWDEFYKEISDDTPCLN